jgi:hypothetical protein
MTLQWVIDSINDAIENYLPPEKKRVVRGIEELKRN